MEIFYEDFCENKRRRIDELGSALVNGWARCNETVDLDVIKQT